MGLKRLDKLIALNCNVSRKDARKLIKDSAVTVNGRICLRAEELIDIDADDVSVKGYSFTIKEHIYIMLNKPKGVVSATRDPAKKTVIDIIPDSLKRKSLFPCGRLDRDTTGLLIITDDGAYAHRIMSPSHHVYKTYEAILSFPLYDEDIVRLESGITLDDGTECLPAKVEPFTDNGLPAARICIREGNYHQVKRMFAAVGNHVEQLRRIQIGSLRLDPKLPEGESREMTEEEMQLVFIDQ
ncbi:MAG: 16S rRNA pseudouridine(516) synthase [Clostridia bacterium]|nr:16S rRNA pseudouridine(516) synthase [Clostridia bacterium]